MIQIRYFASLRERLSTGAEQIPASALVSPNGEARVADVLHLLRQRGAPWSEALEGNQVLLAAVNQAMAGPDTPVRDGDEVAFFPPVTGG
jgi:molybdopterin synthase sulfur carrier subunit